MPDHEQLWRQLLEISGEHGNVPKTQRDWFIGMATTCLNCDEVPPERKSHIRGLLLKTYMAEYRFSLAEKVAERLHGNTAHVPEAACALGTFYTQTRRYKQADKVLQEALQGCDIYANTLALRQAIRDCDDRASGRKGPYKPMPRENKEQVLADFEAFLHAIGTDNVVIPKMAVPKTPVSKRPSPKPAESKILPVRAAHDEQIRLTPNMMPGLRTFVAYDLETTGLSHAEDNITEIGAVRVVDGEIVAAFQQLVKPHSREIPPLVEDLTGITNEMVAAAPHIRDVLPEFAAFLGDDILMGYNNVHFDNKFLFRDANLFRSPIPNRTFDLLPWSKSLVSVFRLSPKGGLGALSRDLHIVNPQAHRALADAMTTARVYLKLLDMVEENQRSDK